MTERLHPPAVRLLLWRACLVVGGALWCLLSAGSPGHADDGPLPSGTGGDDAVSIDGVGSVPPAVPQLVQPAEHAVAEIARPVAQPALEPGTEPVREPVVAPVRQAAEPAVKRVVEPVHDVVEAVVQPAIPVAEPALEPVLRVLVPAVAPTRPDELLPSSAAEAGHSHNQAAEVDTSPFLVDGLPTRGGSWSAPSTAGPDDAREALGPRPGRTTATSYIPADAPVIVAASNPGGPADDGRTNPRTQTDQALAGLVRPAVGDVPTAGVERPSPAGGGAVVTAPLAMPTLIATGSRISGPGDRIAPHQPVEPEHTPD